MFTYFILTIGTVLICTFAILNRLRKMQQTQQYQSQWLQELLLKTADPMIYRRQFQAGRHPYKELNPVMLSPYVPLMTEEQNHRYRAFRFSRMSVALISNFNAWTCFCTLSSLSACHSS